MTFHGIRVDLAHVPSSISLSHVTYVQIPRPVLAMCHSYPVILSNNVTMNCQDCLCIHPQPRHLQQTSDRFQLYALAQEAYNGEEIVFDLCYLRAMAGWALIPPREFNVNVW